jgi:KUP system potassium uptake protein
MSNSHSGHHGHQPKLAATTLAALGIVFGDIGTSPLYAFRECFSPHHGLEITRASPAGAASLIIWALLVIVTINYLTVIIRLDNRGEGGILALAALIRGSAKEAGGREVRLFLLLGLAGSALIYADGMLTPAISVLSAVEGLAISAPVFSHWILPISVCILVCLFTIQRFGTGKVGVLFGPVVTLWFLSMGVLGLRSIIAHPEVLLALSPHTGLSYLIHEWRHALPLLSAVFLAVTGAEALYADLGHFGAKPIRLGWGVIVLPSLVLNYLGQAALLSADPSAIRNPFFLLAPEFLRFPLTILATMAAVIASQALISGVFSITTQAIQLGCLPRVHVRHTSDLSMGQVYVPAVNHMLAAACVLLVLAMGSSAKLAGAYGIAISLTMAITSVLFFSACQSVWGWSLLKTRLVTGFFLVCDGSFLCANLMKIHQGGWFPLVVAVLVFALMITWLWGRERLYRRISKDALPVDVLLRDLGRGRIHRVPGTAIYMSGKGTQVPTALLHNLKHNQVLHERVILLHVMTLDQPRAGRGELLEHQELGEGLHRVTLKFGFAETPDVPAALKTRLPESIRFQPGKATYFLGSETYGVGKKATFLDRVRLSLFAVMARNASPATAYFQLPPGRVVELGAQITL